MPGAPTQTQVSPVWIKLNGTFVSQADLGQVVDVTVEQDLALPDAFTIRIADMDDDPSANQMYAKIFDADKFKVGVRIDIGMGYEETAGPVIENGEITSLELDVNSTACMLVVRGYARAHRMHRERKSRTFNRITDASLVRQIAGNHGLTAMPSATSVVHEHIFQDNLTDWELLRDRAQKIGFELFVRNQTLYFREPSSAGQPHVLTLLANLVSVHTRISGVRQVGTVEVRGWDPTRKDKIVGTASSPTPNGKLTDLRTQTRSVTAFGTGKAVVAEQPVTSQSEARDRAVALQNQLAGEFLQVEGVCHGDPALKPGERIRLARVSRRLDGMYYLSAVTHRVTPREGYLCTFAVNGKRPSTLTGLLDGAAPKSSHPGVVTAIVTNNKDPQNRGRVKVKYPWLNDAVESGWIRLATPMAGPGRGFFWLPEVNDEVVVAFEHGDINTPYVVGAVWNGQQLPPKQATQVVNATGKVDQRVIKSRLGHTITLDDSEATPGISIYDKTNNNFIKFDSTTNDLTIKTNGNVNIEARTKIKLKAATIELDATGQSLVKGQTVSVEATAQSQLKGATVNVEASGLVGVKGATGMVQANTAMTVKGTPLLLNP